jgi:hypothetical protein
MHRWKELVELYRTMYNKRKLEQLIISLDLDIFHYYRWEEPSETAPPQHFSDTIIVGRSQVKQLLLNIFRTWLSLGGAKWISSSSTFFRDDFCWEEPIEAAPPYIFSVTFKLVELPTEGVLLLLSCRISMRSKIAHVNFGPDCVSDLWHVGIRDCSNLSQNLFSADVPRNHI